MSCWERYFLFGPCKRVMKKSSVENWQSTSGVSSEQLVESWEDGVESSGVEC
jgi:hypothetical protein